MCSKVQVLGDCTGLVARAKLRKQKAQMTRTFNGEKGGFLVKKIPNRFEIYVYEFSAEFHLCSVILAAAYYGVPACETIEGVGGYI